MRADLSLLIVLMMFAVITEAERSESQTQVGRTSGPDFCPPGSQFSTFGFVSFILIAVQTVINIVNAREVSS